MRLKEPLTFEKQIEKLKAHGMRIDDEEKAEKLLREFGYYRFKGYALQYRKEINESEYIEGLSFDSIYRIYQFDESLRNLFRKYLEIVEVYYKNQISYGFSIVKCIVPPYDQHYNENNFFDKNGYREVMDSFKKEKNYYKDNLAVKHHTAKYGNKMPLWVMVEFMSFSSISKLYHCMYVSEKQRIANVVGVSCATLENHLHCLTVLRNKCSHAARLYNTRFNPPAKFTKQFLKKYSEVKNNSLFAYALILLKRLPNERIKSMMLKDLQFILEEFQGDIDLSLIGFPVDHMTLLKNNIK